MIRLSRDRTSASIHATFVTPKREELEKELLVNQRRIRREEIDKHPFRSSIWKNAKDQLKVDSHDKCAYCEAPTSMVAFGDVEHYRPKSIYWWLAYNYDNYLLSCQLCNQAFKSDNFPVENGRMTGPGIRRNTSDSFINAKVGTLGPDPTDTNQVDLFEAAHRVERPLLVNPYVDDPSTFYAWEVDNVIVPGEVTLVPHPADSSTIAFVDAADEFYGLNRLELRQARYQIFFLYASFRIIRDDNSNPSGTRQIARDAIARMVGDNAPFAGMLRYFETLSTVPAPPP